MSQTAVRTWDRYDKLRAQGFTQAESARKVGISKVTAWRREKRLREEMKLVFVGLEDVRCSSMRTINEHTDFAIDELVCLV